MLYVNSNFIDSKYKYLVDYGDNYVLLSKDSYINGSSGDPDTVNCYIQYFSPSFQCFPVTYSSEEYHRFNDISSYITDDYHYMQDFPITLILSLLVLFCLVIIFNGFTRIVRKYGLFFGS